MSYMGFAFAALGFVAGWLWGVGVGAKWEREEMFDVDEALGEARAEIHRLNDLIDAYQIRVLRNGRPQ